MEQGVAYAALDLDSPERFQLLRRELGVSSFGINLILLQPRQQGRIHRHTHQEEVFVVLEGTLTLLADDGFEQDLGPGEVVRVAPDVRRRLENRGAETVALLAMGGATEHEGRDGRAWTAWDATDSASPQDMPLPEDLPASELRRG
jgi:uncharacterized cupin superfamily protein